MSRFLIVTQEDMSYIVPFADCMSLDNMSLRGEVKLAIAEGTLWSIIVDLLANGLNPHFSADLIDDVNGRLGSKPTVNKAYYVCVTYRDNRIHYRFGDSAFYHANSGNTSVFVFESEVNSLDFIKASLLGLSDETVTIIRADN